MSEPSGWQLAGRSVAEAYEHYIKATFGDAWTQAFIQLAAPAEGDRVLDVACGTGAAARYSAPLVGPTGRVVGLDLNPGMLSIARGMPAPEGIPIEWREGNATALPFPNASFDLVCCHQGLQFFPDKLAALREMLRVLAPTGGLALAVWRGLEHQPFYAALTEALERYVSLENGREPPSGFHSRASRRASYTRHRSRLSQYPGPD